MNEYCISILYFGGLRDGAEGGSNFLHIALQGNVHWSCIESTFYFVRIMSFLSILLELASRYFLSLEHSENKVTRELTEPVCISIF